MAPTEIDGVEGLLAAVGCQLGTSAWSELTKDQLDAFAGATGDRSAAGPAGVVAPANLVLSLSNFFLPQLLEVTGVAAGVNYGTGKVRFPEPVPLGSRLRGSAELVAAEPVPGGLQTTIVITIEVEGLERPACVVEALSRWLT